MESIEYIGAYDVLYVKRLSATDARSSKMQKYGIFILHRGNDGSFLKVLENLRWFYTFKEARNSLLGVTSFEDAYFDAWYDQPTFESQIKLPGIGTIDQKTMQAIIDEWARRINDGHRKLESTRKDSLIYGPRPWQSSLTDLLIKYHLNPVTSIEAVNEKATKLGVRFPENPDLRQGRKTIMVVDSVRQKIRG